MLSCGGVQPCFQLLRIGSASSSSGDSAVGGDSVAAGAAAGGGDLFTFRPALSHSVFRLGRAAELCDVTLDSPTVSRIHAELHAEREGQGQGEREREGGPQEDRGGWRVHVKDRSSHGTWVNEVRLQRGALWELSDGDTLTLGGQAAPGSPEFYFLFQKVKVRPLDFDAITIPKAGTFSSDLQNRIRTSLDRRVAANLDLSRLSLNRATVILNSIGSLSKVKGSAWTFQRSRSLEAGGPASDPGSSSPPSPPALALLPPSTPPPFPRSGGSSAGPKAARGLQTASRSRRKSAHTVLLEDDSSDEPRGRAAPAAVADEGQRARPKKRRRLYKSEPETFACAPPLPLLPPPPPAPLPLAAPQRPPVARPFPAGIRTIGSFHGAMTNSRLNQHLLQPSFAGPKDGQKVQRGVQTVTHGNIAAFRQQKSVVARGPQTGAQRGRRRAHSSPVFSPLVVGGENYSLASPSVRISTEDRGRMPFNRFHHAASKRRGRPRKHPPPPRPSLPSPSSSSSSSSSGSSSSGSSSSSSSGSDDEDDDDEEEEEEEVTGAMEPCAAPRCRLPQQDTVQWIQCDVCDAWFHLDCLHVDRKRLLRDPNADFHCGCC